MFRITKVINAVNMPLHAQWYAPIGYIWNNTRFLGAATQGWYNNTGRDVTLNFKLKNAYWDTDSELPGGAFIYINTSASVGGSCVLAMETGSRTGTVICPAGKYIVLFVQHNGEAHFSLWEK